MYIRKDAYCSVMHDISSAIWLFLWPVYGQVGHEHFVNSKLQISASITNLFIHFCILCSLSIDISYTIYVFWVLYKLEYLIQFAYFAFFSNLHVYILYNFCILRSLSNDIFYPVLYFASAYELFPWKLVNIEPCSLLFRNMFNRN